eukprot:9770911-Lingulodinium_polyedra.AAC.1
MAFWANAGEESTWAGHNTIETQYVFHCCARTAGEAGLANNVTVGSSIRLTVRFPRTYVNCNCSH